MSARVTATLAMMLCLIPGCADRTPARIELTVPPVIVKLTRIPIAAAVVNAGGERIEGQALSYSADPPEVLQVDKDGSLLCRKTGDATLEAIGAGLSARLTVKCRIPTQIVMPEQRRLLLGAGPVRLEARALGEKGRLLTEAPVLLSSSDPSILRIEGDRAHPVAVGHAVLKASVGSVVAVAPMEVVETVIAESVRLADGDRRSWTVERGTYRVEIEVEPTHRVEQGVTASWEGTRCAQQPEAKSHRFTCEVPGTATLTIANPETYGFGVPVSGSIAVYRAPGD